LGPGGRWRASSEAMSAVALMPGSFQPGTPGSPTFIEAFYHFKLGGRMS
jgi:hypothetical protein